MSYFGLDRKGLPKKIWISETESVDVPGTHGPTRLAGFFHEPEAAPGVVLVGFERSGLADWLPEHIDETCEDCGRTYATCVCDELDDLP